MSNHPDATLVDHIGELYLNENYSDVVIRVNDEELPGHRNILSQRSPVLREMLMRENSESLKQSINFADTSVLAVKLFLKFLYTGVIQLNLLTLNVIFGVLKLAITYKVTQLEEVIVNHLKSICNDENLYDILNTAVNIPHKILIRDCMEKARNNAVSIISGQNFNKLPVIALACILSSVAGKVPDLHVFEVFVGWMKANPEESQHFPALLEQINLAALPKSDLVTLYGLVQGNDVLKILYDQIKKVRIQDGNVLVRQCDARVLKGGASTFFTSPEKDATLKHAIGNNDKNITIDLGHRYKLNFLIMELSKDNQSYCIEVTDDTVHWTRIIDYSTYPCRSVQRLYFNEQIISRIRIRGIAARDGMFEISRLEAYYTTEPLTFDPETNIVKPSDNVATVEKNAVVIEPDNSSNEMLCGAHRDFTWAYIGKSIIVQLPQPYLLDSMNITLHETDNRLYNYNVEVSTDKRNWTRVLSEENVTGWRCAKFDLHPVIFVKLNGTYSTSTILFSVVKFECFASHV